MGISKGSPFLLDVWAPILSEKVSVEIENGIPCFYSESEGDIFRVCFEDPLFSIPPIPPFSLKEPLLLSLSSVCTFPCYPLLQKNLDFATYVALRFPNLFFPILKQMGLRIVQKEPFLYVNPLFVRLKKLIQFADKGFLLDEEYLEFSYIVQLFFRKEIGKEFFTSPQSSSPLQDQLKPLLENRVTLFSPKENKERFFQVEEVIHAFFRNLESRGIDFFGFLKGSSLVNHCVAPVWQECGDIDVQIALCSSKINILEKLHEVESSFFDALSLLFGYEIEGERNWDTFHINTIYSTLEEMQMVHWIFNPTFGSKNLPCEITLHFLDTQLSDVLTDGSPYFMKGPFSFFIPVKAFKNSLGSVGPNAYVLSCLDHNLEMNIERTLKKEFKFLDLKNDLFKRWLRYFIILTEGFSDPFSSLREVEGKYSPFFSKKNTFSFFEEMIKNKKKNPDYYLFCLINILFHSSLKENDPMNILVIEELYRVLEKRSSLENILWAKNLMALCKQHPKSSIPFLLKQIIPLHADTISYKKHLGEDCMQCELLHQGRVFYLLIPFFKEEEKLKSLQIGMINDS